MNATSPELSSNAADEPGRPTRSLTRPTERDYDLYRRHSFEFVSQSELAKEHGITQQRVSQVLRNVERWVASHPEDEEAQQVRHSAGDRWEAVIALSMRAFRKSQHDQEVTRQRTLVRGGTAEGTEPDVTSTIEKTVRPQCGDVRYLHAAMRAMEKQARLFPNGDIIPRVLAEPEPLTEAAKLGDEEIVDSKVEPDDQRTSDLPLKMLMALGAARDPQQAANISRHGPPHTQGSPRDPRRKRERRHNESGPPQLDIGPADRGGIDVSICGPSPGG